MQDLIQEADTGAFIRILFREFDVYPPYATTVESYTEPLATLSWIGTTLTISGPVKCDIEFPDAIINQIDFEVGRQSAGITACPFGQLHDHPSPGGSRQVQ
jgi:hypothetical protein